MKSFKANIYLALVLRFFIALLLFTICRIIFYYFNHDHYADVSSAQLLKIFYGGLKFDIAGLLYLLSPYILSQIIPLKIRHHETYQKASYWLYVVPLIVGIVVNLADTAYFHVTLKRTTFAIVKQFSNETNLGTLFLHFLGEYWYLFLILIIASVVVVFANKTIKVKQVKNERNLFYYGASSGLFLLFALLIVIGIRGGYRHSTRPITLSNATKYISKPNQRALVLNTPFCLIRTINEDGLELKPFFSREEQESIYSAFHSGVNKPDRPFKKKNVVLFILESFSREHIGALNKHIPDYKGFTPFVDSLIHHSYTFKHAFANGQKSISGMTSNIASIPSLKTPFILSPYSGNDVTSLANTLKSENYHTAFFHGGPNGSMGFDAFAKQAGFEAYLGLNEYGNDDDFDGYWGIWDEEFFQFYAHQMNQMQEPFFTAMFSVSSHHPFHVPERYETVFPEGRLPIQKTIAYTDFALKKFFESARKMDWFENTIFIITADHASTYNELSIKEYKSPAGVLGVPIIIYDPSDSTLVGFDDTTVVQQIDIVPTVLNLINYPKDYIAFGTNMLNLSEHHFSINYESGYFLLFKNNFLLRYDGEKTEGFYDYQKDPHLLNNLMTTNNDQQPKMLALLQAFIQEHNRRLIRNEMVLR